MSKLLITGVAGFIGSSLSEFFLEKGFHVIGLYNFDSFYDRHIKEGNLRKSLSYPSFSFHEIDISNPDEFRKIKAEIDIVIHLAAKAGVLPSLKDPENYIHTNINGTRYLLEWMKENQILKMIFASSSSVYGNQTKVPFSEMDNVDFPISPYAFTKKSCELLNQTYHHLYKMDIINLRFFTVYGPRQRPDLAIHKFVKLIEENKPITMYGDGSTARDYTFITDIISGIDGALTHLEANNGILETINIGNNHPVKLLDLIHLLYRMMKAVPDIKPMPMQPGDVTITYADISKANKLLGYTPKVKFEDGLKIFMKWYLGKRY
jgi:nucleoside-diphosphate-sugar epimerase